MVKHLYESLLYGFKYWVAASARFCFRNFCVLMEVESSFENACNDRGISALLDNDDRFFCLRKHFHLSFCHLCLNFVLLLASFRNYTSIKKSDTDGEAGGRGSKGLYLPSIFLT